MSSLPYLPEMLNVALMLAYWLSVYVFVFYIGKRMKMNINYISIYYFIYPILAFALNTVLLFVAPSQLCYIVLILAGSVLLLTKLVLYVQKNQAKNAIEMRLMLRFNQDVNCKIKFKQTKAFGKWTMYVEIKTVETATKKDVVQYLNEYVNPKKYEAVIY